MGENCSNKNHTENIFHKQKLKRVYKIERLHEQHSKGVKEVLQIKENETSQKPESL